MSLDQNFDSEYFWVFNNTNDDTSTSSKKRRLSQLPSGVYFIKGEHGKDVFCQMMNTLAENVPQEINHAAPSTPPTNPTSLKLPLVPKKPRRIHLRRAGIHHDIMKNLF